MLKGMRTNRAGMISLLALAVFLATLVLALAGLVRVLPAFLSWSHPDDLIPYYNAATALNAGNSPYVYGYLYPPFFAAVLRPLATLSLETASGAWLVLNLLAMLITAGLGTKILGSGRAAFPIALAIVVLIPASSETLLYGQVNLLIALLIVGSLYFASQSPPQSGSDMIAGALLGLAVAIKVYPIMIAIAFIIRRRYRSLLSMLVTLGCTVVIGLLLGGGPENTIYYFANLLPGLMGTWNPFPMNQSVYGVAARFFSVNTFEFPVFTADNFVTVTSYPLINMPEIGRILAQLLSAAVLISSCLVLFGRVRSTGGRLPIYADFAILVSASLITSPITWDYYYSLLVVPYLAVLASLRLSRPIPWLVVALSMFFIAVQRYWRPLVVYVNSPFLALFGFLGVSMLWVLLLYKVASGRLDTGSQIGPIT